MTCTTIFRGAYKAVILDICAIWGVQSYRNEATEIVCIGLNIGKHADWRDMESFVNVFTDRPTVYMIFGYSWMRQKDLEEFLTTGNAEAKLAEFLSGGKSYKMALEWFSSGIMDDYGDFVEFNRIYAEV